MQVQDVKIRVRRSFGDESSVQVTDADLLRWINDGQREVVMQNPELLEKTSQTNAVAGTSVYTLPTDLRQLRSLKFQNSAGLAYFHLQGLSVQEFDEYIDGYDGSLFGQADPVVYCTFAGAITVFPTPAANVTNGFKLYYYRQPTDMVNDTDVLDLPLGYHAAVVEYSLKQAYELDEDWTSVGNKAQEFNAAVAGQKAQEKSHNRESYTRITVCREDEDWY